MTVEAGAGRRRQTEIYVTGAGGKRPAVPVHPERLWEEARRKMSPQAWAYVAGGAGGEATMAANREAFAAFPWAPRVFRDVSRRDLSVELLGVRHRAPLLLAPIGALDMIQPQADLLCARAAHQEGIGMIFSNQAGVPMETCAQAMGDTPRWFQLYWSSDQDVVASFLERAEQVGCQAIVLTLDTTLLGWRPRDLDLGYLPFLRGYGLAQYLSDPVFRQRIPSQAQVGGPRPQGAGLLGTALSLARKGRPYGLSLKAMQGAVSHFVNTYSRPDLRWEDIETLRQMTRLPLLLKGIRRREDAEKARAMGVDGLIVSNHGGRQVDGERGALFSLQEVVAGAGDLPVLFDSGIRTGSDVAKALALGAKACLLGRPFAYGLALGGEEGVREVIRNIIAELDLTLALLGCSSLEELPEVLAL
ncbi:MAG: alpha-hydroxy-acid oxidizing protein [Bacillota bacterium]|nr:alpha-hydroxy-acid oxidizing protein [Bacillota bacterium]